jgi:hypothetical protein
VNKVEKEVAAWLNRTLPDVRVGKIDHREYDNGRVELRVIFSFPSWGALKEKVLGIESD